MFGRIRRYREWRRTHEASWEGYTTRDANGITRFQSELLAELRQDPGVLACELVRGKNESYYKGNLARGGQEFYIYEDEAGSSKGTYERWAYDSRQQLTEDFLSRAREGKI